VWPDTTISLFTFKNDWRFEMKSFTVILFLMALSLVCLAGATQADTSNLITNGDFGTGSINPWAQQGATVGDGDGNATPPSCLMAGGSDPNAVGYISQHERLSGATSDYIPQLGDVLTLDFDSANVAYDVNAPASMLATLMYRPATGWDVSLNFEFDMPGVAAPVWQHNHLVYTVGADSPLLTAGITNTSLSIENLVGSAATRVDNISLTVTPAATPEPGAFVLLAMGLSGLLAYAWRRRK
jgi:hypothetical protein